MKSNKVVSKSQTEAIEGSDEKIKDTVKNLQNKKANIQVIQDMLHDVYNTEIQRKNSMEVKGAALLGAAAIAVSVISIGLSTYNGVENALVSESVLTRSTMIILAYAVVHLIAAGVSVLPVFDTYPYQFSNSDQVRRIISIEDAEKGKLEWISEKLVGIEINEKLILKLNNWVSAAGKHFMHGLIAISVAYFILYGGGILSISNQNLRVGSNSQGTEHNISHSSDIHESLLIETKLFVDK
jgi:hypothetical protein